MEVFDFTARKKAEKLCLLLLFGVLRGGFSSIAMNEHLNLVDFTSQAREVKGIIIDRCLQLFQVEESCGGEQVRFPNISSAEINLAFGVYNSLIL